MDLDALGMNSDKFTKYNSVLDLLGARQNSANGVIVQRTATAGIEALIADDMHVVMDVLLTQHIVRRIIASDGQEQPEIAVAPPQTQSILSENAGLNNLIGNESVDRLQKVQKVAKAVGVVQNQQRIQPRPAYNIFAQVPRNISMTIGTGMIGVTPMNTAPQMNYIPAYSSNYGYGYVGNQQGAYVQFQNLFQYQRYNDLVFDVAAAIVVQPKQP
ncbi:MAG: hypothetical protein EZS28_023783 [Streblomastix strix]|uniref:Uncharacterized protein n=1 Tax=Streblomastix strix TaxID=222440 RepID=A0A5J4VE99_9EUKA|nr:MAG: hypothetical protein EZS28_023783 [Streblomastix strix]